MLRKDWLARLQGLVVFRGLLDTELLRALAAALRAEAGDTAPIAAFEAAMFVRGTDWTKVLLELVLEHENLCLKVAAGGDAGPVLEGALDSELQFLQALGTATPQELFGAMPEDDPRCGFRRRLPHPAGAGGQKGLRYVCPVSRLYLGGRTPCTGAMPRPAAPERAAGL